MKETIELSPSILDYLNQEPEERKYWRAGYRRNDLSQSNMVHGVYTSETAAWKSRECYERDAAFSRVTDAPYQVTRQEANEYARSIHCHAVIVFDEQFQVVEEWTV